VGSALPADGVAPWSTTFLLAVHPARHKSSRATAPG
jgi:hypothetical protein